MLLKDTDVGFTTQIGIRDFIPVADTADELAKVIYSSKDRRESRSFNALDWLAQLVTHIPNKSESRRWREFGYYGYYSNKARGMRQKAECDDDTPALVESPPVVFGMAQELGEVDPEDYPSRLTTSRASL